MKLIYNTIPVSTRRHFDVDTTLYGRHQRYFNVETTSCACWDKARERTRGK